MFLAHGSSTQIRLTRGCLWYVAFLAARILELVLVCSHRLVLGLFGPKERFESGFQLAVEAVLLESVLMGFSV